MKITPANIVSIKYWHRKVESVEQIEKIEIKKIDKQFEISIDEKEFKPLDSKELRSILSTLNTEIDIQNYQQDYLVHIYDNDLNDLNAKFYLEVYFIDCTYIAIKGLHPFKQPKYQEIIALFENYFK